jgi:hypothetical protein
MLFEAIDADAGTPVMEAAALERLALALSARLRGRLRAEEDRRDAARTEAERRDAELEIRALEMRLARTDLQIAAARDRRGETLEVEPGLHRMLTADGRVIAFARPAPPAAARRDAPAAA